MEFILFSTPERILVALFLVWSLAIFARGFSRRLHTKNRASPPVAAHPSATPDMGDHGSIDLQVPPQRVPPPFLRTCTLRN